MKSGLFEAQLNEIESILKGLELLKERNLFPQYPEFGMADFRGLEYTEVWRRCYRDQLYNFMLMDFALIQFRNNQLTNRVNFAFYETPFETITYQDFLVNEIGFPPDELDQIGDSFRDEYEQALNDGDFRRGFTPLRYDYAPEAYNEGRHPAAHIHFGFDNNIRVCTAKLLRPMSFLLLILRQYYPDKWVEFTNLSRAPTTVRQIRDALDDVDPSYLRGRDHWEMILG